MTRDIRVALTAVVLGLWTAMAVAGEDGSAGSPAAPLMPNAAERQRDWDTHRARVARERAERATPEARRERQLSRTRYRAMTAARAREFARKRLSRDVTAPAWRPLADREVLRIDDENTAVVEVGGERRMLESTGPVAVRGRDGAFRALNLGLELRDGAFRPVSAAVATTMPRELSSGLTVGTADVRLQVVADGDVASGESVEGSVVYANSRKDADTAVRAVPGGLEIFDVLRSEDSPETLRFRFAGEGVRVSAQGNGGGVEVLREGRAVAHLSEAVAFDADDQPVDVKTSVRGENTVVIDVKHRDRDVAYPITVDPIYEWYNWHDPYGGPGLGRGYEHFYPVRWGPWWLTSSGYNPNDIGVSPYTWQRNTSDWWGKGLYIHDEDAREHYFHYNYWARWEYRVPRESIRITNAGAVYVDNERSDVCAEAGMFTNSGPIGPWWRRCDAFFGQRGYVSANGQDAKVFAFGAWIPSDGWRRMTVKMGHAEIELDDAGPPTVTATATDGWTTDPRVHASATDIGFGVQRLLLNGTRVDQWAFCNGTKLGGACVESPPAVEASVGEGRTKLDWQAFDGSGKASSVTAPPQNGGYAKVDRTAPTITTVANGDIQPRARVSPGEYRLQVDARDIGADGRAANSGVKLAEYRIDSGEWQSQDKDCSSGDCTSTFFVDTTALSEGPHHVAVRVTDGVNLQSGQLEFDFSVVRDGPSTAPVYEDLELDATNEARVSLLSGEGRIIAREGGGILPRADEDQEPSRPYLRRYLDSSAAGVIPGAFGRGGTADMGPDVRLTDSLDGTKTFHAPGGEAVTFRKQADGTYFAQDNDNYALRQAENDGWRVVSVEPREHYVLTSGGQLSSIVRGDGYRRTAHYDAAGQLAAVTDASGARLTVSTNVLGVVTRVQEEWSGRAWDYSYTQLDLRLTLAEAPQGPYRYTYTPSGTLGTLMVADGRSYAFEVSEGRTTTVSRDSRRLLTVSYEDARTVAIADDGHRNVAELAADPSRVERNLVIEAAATGDSDDGTSVNWEWERYRSRPSQETRFVRHRFRWRRLGGPWSVWDENAQDGRDLADVQLGESIDVEVASVVADGTVSPIISATLAVVEDEDSDVDAIDGEQEAAEEPDDTSTYEGEIVDCVDYRVDHEVVAYRYDADDNLIGTAQRTESDCDQYGDSPKIFAASKALPTCPRNRRVGKRHSTGRIKRSKVKKAYTVRATRYHWHLRTRRAFQHHAVESFMQVTRRRPGEKYRTTATDRHVRGGSKPPWYIHGSQDIVYNGKVDFSLRIRYGGRGIFLREVRLGNVTLRLYTKRSKLEGVCRAI